MTLSCLRGCEIGRGVLPYLRAQGAGYQAFQAHNMTQEYNDYRLGSTNCFHALMLLLLYQLFPRADVSCDFLRLNDIQDERETLWLLK